MGRYLVIVSLAGLAGLTVSLLSLSEFREPLLNVLGLALTGLFG